MTQIEQIKNKIEGLIDKEKHRYYEEYDCAYRDGNNAVCYTLLSFIESLEKEPKDVFDDHLSELIPTPINIPPISEDAEIVEDSAHLGIHGESLEKESKVELDKLIEEVHSYLNMHYWPDDVQEVLELARHFYELGFNAKSDAPKIKGWIARDISGDLYFFHYDCKPHRTDGIFYSECSEDVFHIDNSLFPEVDWKSEPIEVELTISLVSK